MGPTSPQVPIPEVTAGPLFSKWNRQVARGPVIMDAKVAGIQILGFLTMFPICNMEVPSPCETKPDTPFSRKEITAKPTIWAQQPATAAPPARPVRPRAAQMAAEKIGRVSAMPTRAETRIPMKKGCNSVAHMIRLPTSAAAFPMSGARRAEKSIPTPMVTSGVTKMSTFVSLETALPISVERMATKSTASGPPAPPSALEANPTVIREKRTRGGASSA